MLETRVRFKSADGNTEYSRTVDIIGKDMRDINEQASKVVKYFSEQTSSQWYYEFVEEKELKEKE